MEGVSDDVGTSQVEENEASNQDTRLHTLVGRSPSIDSHYHVIRSTTQIFSVKTLLYRGNLEWYGLIRCSIIFISMHYLEITSKRTRKPTLSPDKASSKSVKLNICVNCDKAASENCIVCHQWLATVTLQPSTILPGKPPTAYN